MNVPKTPYEFDYDLWTTEDGKCMVRVKRTGEVTEVSMEVMRFLRAQEKQCRRNLHEESELSLSADISLDESIEASSWCIDTVDSAETVETRELEEHFLHLLTFRQRDIYVQCLKFGKSQAEYSAENNISKARVSQAINCIQKNAEKFFAGC